MRWHPATCRDCGKSSDEVGHISARGCCVPCATRRSLDAIERSTAEQTLSNPKFIAQAIKGHRRALMGLERLARERGIDPEQIAV